MGGFSRKQTPPFFVIPAKAGIQKKTNSWSPACAGVTTLVISCENIKNRIQNTVDRIKKKKGQNHDE